jgi:hypothetical protein
VAGVDAPYGNAPISPPSDFPLQHHLPYQAAHNLPRSSAAQSSGVHMFAHLPGGSAHRQALQSASHGASWKQRSSGSSDLGTPWQPCYQPDRPLQAGFLRNILIPHLVQLRSLHLLRCSRVLDAEDYRAIGRLHNLNDLSIESLVCSSFNSTAFSSVCTPENQMAPQMGVCLYPCGGATCAPMAMGGIPPESQLS